MSPRSSSLQMACLRYELTHACAGLVSMCCIALRSHSIFCNGVGRLYFC